jgi:DNA-binding GntR family transcriptional regulator
MIMKKTQKLNKRQYAYKVILSRILDGSYVPGQRIIIDQIAKEVGSSHIPVREAIHQLEAEEFIEFKPNIGAIVRGIDNELYAENLQVLALLEGYATSLSATKITEEGIEELESINNEMRVMLQNYELDTLGALNREFHFYIYSFCPNKLLIRNIKDVWDRLDVVRRTGFTFFPNRTPQSIEEHAHLIKLFKEHTDGSSIEKYARKHKLNTLEAFKKRG